MGKKSSITPLENPEFNGNNPAVNIDLTAIEKRFFLKEPEQITKFLALNPYLIPVLSETANILDRYFPGGNYNLHWYVDPEIAAFKWLTIEIPTKYSPREASDRLNRFDDEWWIDNEYKTNGNVIVNVEFE